jgi:hypothetical protein
MWSILSMTTDEHGTHPTCFPRMPALGIYSPSRSLSDGTGSELTAFLQAGVPSGNGSAARRQHSRHLLRILFTGWAGDDAGQVKTLLLDSCFWSNVSENVVISAIFCLIRRR